MNKSNTNRAIPFAHLRTAGIAFAALVLLASIVHLSAMPGDADKPAAAEEKPAAPAKTEEPRTIRLTLHPAPEPRPALKYLLLPPRPELKSGNAAVHYYALLDGLPVKDENDRARMDAGLNTPISELSRDALPDGWPPTWVQQRMHRAARQLYCDWQLAGDEGFQMALPSLGVFRRAANWQSVYARVLISEGDFDGALEVLQSGMAMGRHVGQDLTLIQGLVGLAIHGVMLQRVEEWVQRPGAPNLYWALTSLPRPLIDMLAVTQWERNMVVNLIPADLRVRMRTGVLTGDDIRRLVDEFVKTMHVLDPQGISKITPDLFRQAPQWVRDSLVKAGYDGELVRTMPAEQVHLLFTIDRHRELLDEQIKWHAVPYWQGAGHSGEAEENLSRTTEKNVILEAIVPAIGRANLLAGRVDRQVALLRVIEAIRMYAAEHNGDLPPTLDAITAVPVPDDPLTGKAFKYELIGEMAIIEPAKPGPEPYDNRRYELTIAR